MAIEKVLNDTPAQETRAAEDRNFPRLRHPRYPGNRFKMYGVQAEHQRGDGSRRLVADRG